MEQLEHQRTQLLLLRRNSGFTLLELLLAISILAIVSVVCYLTFSTVLNAWKRGNELAENMQHGDFVMEQLAMAMRSAYFPAAASGMSDYGFVLEEYGTGEGGSARISWTKIGSALVGRDCPFAGSPHRVQFYLDTDDDGDTAVTVKSWRIQGQMEDFDSDKVKPIYLSKKVKGFKCRPAFEKVDDEYEFLDEWEHTNNLPLIVELTLVFESVSRKDDDVEVKRVVQIPVAKPFTAKGVAATAGDNTSGSAGRSAERNLNQPGMNRGPGMGGRGRRGPAGRGSVPPPASGNPVVRPNP